MAAQIPGDHLLYFIGNILLPFRDIEPVPGRHRPAIGQCVKQQVQAVIRKVPVRRCQMGKETEEYAYFIS